MNTKAIIVSLFIINLAGCAVANRPGSGGNPALDSDYQECQQAALLEHPVKMHQHVSTPTYTSGGVSYTLAPEVQEIDLNRDRRNRSRDVCMTAKGWSFTPIVGWSKKEP